MIDGCAKKIADGELARSRAVVLAFSIAVAGLSSCHESKSPPLDAAPPPSLNAKPPAKESERAKDAMWMRAQDGDPIELARLADSEGAGGLLLGLEDGGPIGLTALAALPFADDAELAYQRLGEILRQIDPVESSSIVGAVYGIALRPRRQVEPEDPPGSRFCAEALLEIAQRTSLAASLRAPAISALRLLADRGAIDAKAIPTDLDAK
jgi:hypothetical protein